MRFSSLFAPLAAALGLAFGTGCGGSQAQTPPRHGAGLTPNPGTTAAASAKPGETPPTASRLPFHLPCGDKDLVDCTNGCAEHHIEDCVTLGSMYMSGEVVSMDQERAIRLYRDACGEGSARGCMRLGDVYHAGLLPPDDAEEMACYRKACEGGANLGCVAAGKAYLTGKGVSANPGAAAALFGRVCERGNASGCFELARLYDRGEGVKKNEKRAFELFSKACQLGLDEGCLVASRTEEMLPPRN